MSAARKLARKQAKPLRTKMRVSGGSKSGKSYLLGAAAKSDFEDYTKRKIVRADR